MPITSTAVSEELVVLRAPPTLRQSSARRSVVYWSWYSTAVSAFHVNRKAPLVRVTLCRMGIGGGATIRAADGLVTAAIGLRTTTSKLPAFSRVTSWSRRMRLVEPETEPLSARLLPLNRH